MTLMWRRSKFLLLSALLLTLCSCAVSDGTASIPSMESSAISGKSSSPPSGGEQTVEGTPEASPAPSSEQTSAESGKSEIPSPSETPTQSAKPPSGEAAAQSETPAPSEEPSPGEELTDEPSPFESHGNTITFRIDGPDGWIFEPVDIPFTEGMTAMDALFSVCTENDILLWTRGSGKLAYIAGIGGYSEKDYGRDSGWVFLINGKAASVGAASYTLQSGDRVSFYYTLDLGKDAEGKE